MRYRDPTFDIDWDLKWEKGDCLNGLGKDKFDLDGHIFSNLHASVPKAVKRVHEIFENPTFLKEKISPADVKQGNLGNCWLMASLTALANMEKGIQRICIEYDTKIGIYGFVFHRDGEWIISIIDDKLYLKSPDWDSPSVQRHLLEQIDREDVEKEYRKTYQTGSQALFFAYCRDQNETWLPLLEKAYAKAHGDYAALSGGWIGEGIEDLTGGVTTELLTSDILDTDEFWNNEILKVNEEFLFGCATGLLDGGYGNRDGISEGHAYVIMEARQLSTGQRLVKLRNPWGKGKKGNWEGPWSDGSKEFTPEAQAELNHKFGNDSVFWISFEDLLRKYQHFDRTRLFMDSPDWRVTQKWISVEVPWNAEFEQRFRVVLKKESPVVLVLSQLDDRYFDGLQGQYSFRLQFRLHNVDSPSEEDYIVRSHGNYLMERSVVTELKSLPAGAYSVFVMVVADRDTDILSVEDVIKDQCRRKVDNNKLARVGMAYDLAHQKAAAHMESKAAIRKAREKAKIKEERIANRRKIWENRHLTRNVVRKQCKKNNEKREQKMHKQDSEAKEGNETRRHRRSNPKDNISIRLDREDKAVQTEDSFKTALSEAEAPQSIPQNENDKGVQTEDLSVSLAESQDTLETPESGLTSPRPIRLPGDGQGPTPGGVYIHERGRRRSYSPPRRSREFPRRHEYVTSEGESSASPVSDFEALFSDDEPSLRPRRMSMNMNVNPGDPPPRSNQKRSKESDDDEPEPWNAVCIVGLRVYSKDEELDVMIYEEGFNDVEKLEGERVEDPGTDGDVEDCEEEEPEKGEITNKAEDKVQSAKDEGCGN